MTKPTLEAAKAKAWEAVEKIDGWLSEVEANALFDLAANAKGPIVEIGSWRGRSTTALALGSMAGNKHSVYSVDPHIGVPPLDRKTECGLNPGWDSSSPQLLRANLDAAGVNGLVKIVHKTSADAAAEIPECDVLFVDGDHDYVGVSRDLAFYMPKVREGGSLILHDCTEGDPGVVQAVDEMLMTRPQEWRPRNRFDSAVLFERRATERHTVMLAAPGPGAKWCAMRSLLQCSLGAHRVNIENSGNGFDDMEILWVRALNMAKRGECTHFAMLHSDIDAAPGWLDSLLVEMDSRDADLVSTVMPLKDQTGCTSCGVGDKDNPWSPFRRFTMREIMEMPETFSISDTPHPDRYLLHNTGCWVADLRKPLWRTVDENGCLVAFLNFPVRARVDADGEIIHERESEDWFFSRTIASLGAKTFISRVVKAHHVGDWGFSNQRAWGSFQEGDEGTKKRWGG